MSYLKLPLNKGQFTIIDKEDFERVNKYKWYAQYDHDSRNYYAIRIEKGTRYYLAYLILNKIPDVTTGLTIDHINRNPLDNRKENLRVINQSQQNINQRIRRTNKSGKIGVRFDYSSNSWRSTWRESGKQKSKSFSILKYGEDKAYLKAIKYREKIEKQIPDYIEALCLDRDNNHISNSVNLDNIEICNIKLLCKRKVNIRNKVGVNGVTFEESENRWICTWRENKIPKKKCFTVGTKENPTYEIAKENAINFRRKIESDLLNTKNIK